jgi:hypothetical protein
MSQSFRTRTGWKSGGLHKGFDTLSKFSSIVAFVLLFETASTALIVSFHLAIRRTRIVDIGNLHRYRYHGMKYPEEETWFNQFIGNVLHGKGQRETQCTSRERESAAVALYMYWTRTDERAQMRATRRIEEAEATSMLAWRIAASAGIVIILPLLPLTVLSSPPRTSL